MGTDLLVLKYQEVRPHGFPLGFGQQKTAPVDDRGGCILFFSPDLRTVHRLR